MTVWGMEPGTYNMFVVLISFAGLAAIMDKSGFVVVDKEGNKESVVKHILSLGTLYAVCYQFLYMLALLII